MLYTLLLLGLPAAVMADPIRPDDLAGSLSGKINGFIEGLNIFHHRYEDVADNTDAHTVYRPYYYPYPMAYPYPVANKAPTVVVSVPYTVTVGSGSPSNRGPYGGSPALTPSVPYLTSGVASDAPPIQTSATASGAPPISVLTSFAISGAPPIPVQSTANAGGAPPIAVQSSAVASGAPPIPIQSSAIASGIPPVLTSAAISGAPPILTSAVVSSAPAISAVATSALNSAPVTTSHGCPTVTVTPKANNPTTAPAPVSSAPAPVSSAPAGSVPQSAYPQSSAPQSSYPQSSAPQPLYASPTYSESSPTSSYGESVPSDVLLAVKDAYSEEDRLLKLASIGSSPFKFDFNHPPSEAVSSGDSGKVTIADRSTFPALYDSGVAMAVFQLQPCALVVPHSHPRASENIIVTKGSLQTQFAAGKNVPMISNDLSELQSTFFPQGSLHYEINPTCEPATFISAFSSDDPGTSIAANELFGLEEMNLVASLGFSQEADGASTVEAIRAQLPDSVSVVVEQCLATCGIQKRDVDLNLLRSFSELKDRYRHPHSHSGPNNMDHEDGDNDEDDDDDDDDDNYNGSEETFVMSKQDLADVIGPLIIDSQYSRPRPHRYRGRPHSGGSRVLFKPVRYDPYADLEWSPITSELRDYDFLDPIVSFFQVHPEDLPQAANEVGTEVQVGIPEGEMPDPVTGQSPNSPMEKRAATPWEIRERIINYFTSDENFDDNASDYSEDGDVYYVETGVLSRVAAHRIVDYLRSNIDASESDTSKTPENAATEGPVKREEAPVNAPIESPVPVTAPIEVPVTSSVEVPVIVPQEVPVSSEQSAKDAKDGPVPLHHKQAVYSPPKYLPAYLNGYIPGYSSEYSSEYSSGYSSEYSPEYAPEYTPEYTPEYAPESEKTTPEKSSRLQRLMGLFKGRFGRKEDSGRASGPEQVVDETYDDYVPVYYDRVQSDYYGDSYSPYYPSYQEDDYYWDYMVKRDVAEDEGDSERSSYWNIFNLDFSSSGKEANNDQQLWWDAFWEVVYDMLRAEQAPASVDGPVENEPKVDGSDVSGALGESQSTPEEEQALTHPDEFQVPDVPDVPSEPSVPGRLPPDPPYGYPPSSEGSDDSDPAPINDDDPRVQDPPESLAEIVAKMREELSTRYTPEELLDILRREGIEGLRNAMKSPSEPGSNHQ